MAIIVSTKIRDCDFTGVKFDAPVDGFAVICRGATGRHCVVMEGCEAAMAEQNLTAADLVSWDEAHRLVEAMGAGNYADF